MRSRCDAPHVNSVERADLLQEDLLPPLLTVHEVAALLVVAPKTVYKLVEEGKLPGVRRIGRRLRFHRGELLAWLDGQESARPRRSR